MRIESRISFAQAVAEFFERQIWWGDFEESSDRRSVLRLCRIADHDDLKAHYDGDEGTLFVLRQPRSRVLLQGMRLHTPSLDRRTVLQEYYFMIPDAIMILEIDDSRGKRVK